MLVKTECVKKAAHGKNENLSYLANTPIESYEIFIMNRN